MFFVSSFFSLLYIISYLNDYVLFAVFLLDHMFPLSVCAVLKCNWKYKKYAFPSLKLDMSGLLIKNTTGIFWYQSFQWSNLNMKARRIAASMYLTENPELTLHSGLFMRLSMHGISYLFFSDNNALECDKLIITTS